MFFMTMFELMDGLWLGDSSFQYETILNDSGNIHIFRVRLCGISTKDVQLTGIQFTGWLNYQFLFKTALNYISFCDIVLK